MGISASLAARLDRWGEVVGAHLPRHTRVGAALRDVRARLPRRPHPGPIGEVVHALGRCRGGSVFFVQVGSNDGDRFDPLSDEILGHRWSGVMVEPVPHVFERLHQHHRRHRRIRLENAAISPQTGPLPFHHLRATDDLTGLPSFYDALGSFRRDVLLKHRDAIPDIEDRIVTIDVPCLTFEELCAKHQVEHIDVVHIDTEGYDLEVLKLIDLERWAPLLVIYEHHHLGPDDLNASRELLWSHGYELLPVGLDTAALAVGSLTTGDAPLLEAWRRQATLAPPT